MGLRRLGAVVVHCWHHVRCGVAAYNIPAFALVSMCVRTLLPLRAIPWCAYVSLPVPTPFLVLFVVVPLYSLRWSRLRAGRSLLLSCAQRGTTW